MHRQVPIEFQVLTAVFPQKTPSYRDWEKFTKELQRETIHELEKYHGQDLMQFEKYRYSGLDYNWYPHRRRLLRNKYHKLLFSAFDALRLTSCEINRLAIWPGTLAERQRVEAEIGRRIAVDDIATEIRTLDQWVDPRYLSDSTQIRMTEETVAMETDDEDQDEGHGADSDYQEVYGEDDAEKDDGDVSVHEFSTLAADQDEDEDAEEGEIDSVGHELNQRLLAYAEARENGLPASFDTEFEQWLGTRNLDSFQEPLQQDPSFSSWQSHALRASVLDQMPQSML